MPFPVAGGASAVYEAVSKATASINAGPSASPKGGLSFADILENVAREGESSLRGAERGSFASAADAIDASDLVATLSDAEQKLRAIVAVRDRLVSALQEIFRMPI
ncbi:MAG: flagellar hook-basal body complex protein FliE [Rickettsiales bacterium]